MRTNSTTDKNYNYDYSGIDESYEEFGEEYEHAENCDWIDDNCTCELSDPETAENARLEKLLEQY